MKNPEYFSCSWTCCNTLVTRRSRNILWTEKRFHVLCVSKINELVDARDLNMGAWFEAQVVNVTKMTKTPKEEAAEQEEEEILYHVKYEE